MSRNLTAALLACFLGFALPSAAQVVFADGFEDASICSWSNGDQTDGDHDGYKICAFDCVDTDDTIHPGATDACGDGIDNDCTGLSDEVCCHPLLQDCSGVDACYYGLMTHAFFCAAPFGMPPSQQEEPCQYLNSCDEGFGCTLYAPPQFDSFHCAAFCSPGGNDCATGETCLLYDQFYSDVAPAPGDFGMCVPNEILP
jgi:hypothetical protein